MRKNVVIAILFIVIIVVALTSNIISEKRGDMIIKTLQHQNNISQIVSFTHLLVDYQNYDLNPMYVAIKLNSYADILYDNVQTREIAEMMQIMTGMLEDQDQLLNYYKEDFNVALKKYGEIAKDDVLSKISNSIFPQN